MRVLVTGSAGFIGHHVVRMLAGRGYDVVGVDRRPTAGTATGASHICDLLDADEMIRVFAAVRPDAVVHLAARTDLDGSSLQGYAANIDGVVNLLRAIRHTPTVQRAICTSSQLVCAIGYQPSSDEDFCPTTLYGRSKVRTEQVWREGDGGGGVWCIVRPTTVWGPGMNLHYVRFFRLIRDGRYFHVGTEPLYKSYGYVGNAAFQIERVLAAPVAQIHRRTFYLADYEPLSLREWSTALQRCLGAPPIRTMPQWVARAAAWAGDLLNLFGWRRFPFNSFRLRNVLTEYQLDLSATKAVCGALPYTMAQGVDETAQWLRKHWASEVGAPPGAEASERCELTN